MRSALALVFFWFLMSANPSIGFAQASNTQKITVRATFDPPIQTCKVVAKQPLRFILEPQTQVSQISPLSEDAGVVRIEGASSVNAKIESITLPPSLEGKAILLPQMIVEGNEIRVGGELQRLRAIPGGRYNMRVAVVFWCE